MRQLGAADRRRIAFHKALKYERRSRSTTRLRHPHAQPGVSMRFISTLMAITAASLLAFSPVQAAEKRVVPADKTSPVGFFYFAAGLAYNCLNSGRGKFSVTTQPKHGKVHLEWRKLKGDFQGGCKGRTMSGVAAWYTPEKGYRGDDAFAIRINVPGLMPGNGFNAGRSWKIQLDVK
jgi:hypothetical protein